MQTSPVFAWPSTEYFIYTYLVIFVTYLVIFYVKLDESAKINFWCLLGMMLAPWSPQQHRLRVNLILHHSMDLSGKRLGLGLLVTYKHHAQTVCAISICVRSKVKRKSN